MKKYFCFLAFILIVTMVGCEQNTSNPTNAKLAITDSQLNFSCLLSPTDSVASWLSDKLQFDEFIFNFYYSKVTTPCQLLVYGRHQNIDTSYDYKPLSAPFQIYDTTLFVTDKNYALGNLLISSDTVTKIINNIPKIGGNMFLFVPFMDTSFKYKHVTYHLYLCNYSFATNKVIGIINLSQIFQSIYIYKDAKGQEYIDLNPCPPAHYADTENGSGNKQ